MRKRDNGPLANRRTPRYCRAARVPRRQRHGKARPQPAKEMALKRLDARIGRAELRAKLDALGLPREKGLGRINRRLQDAEEE